jgi:hypothetical protein
MLNEIFNTSCQNCMSKPKKTSNVNAAKAIRNKLGAMMGPVIDDLQAGKYLREWQALSNTRWSRADDKIKEKKEMKDAINAQINDLRNAYFETRFKGKLIGEYHITINLHLPNGMPITDDLKMLVELNYLKLKSVNELFGFIEFIVPVFEGEGEIKIDLNRGNKKNNPRASIKLNPKKDANVNGNFKLRYLKATYVVIGEFVKKGQDVIVHYPLYNAAANPTEAMKFLISLFVESWIANMNDDDYLSYYSVVVDFAMKFGFTANFVYFEILKKFDECWSQSGTFIEIYVPLFLTCYAMRNKLTLSEQEETYMKELIPNLEEKVVQRIKKALSKSDIIEKPALTQLIILLSVVHDPATVSDHFDSMITQSIIDITDSVVKALLIIPSNKEATNQVAALYSCLSLKGVNPKKGPNGVVMIDFDIESILKASTILLNRAGKLIQFFTQSSVPKFADHSKRIQNNFKSLSFLLVSAFVSHEPRPQDQLTFQFLLNYKQLWRLIGEEEDKAPEILFMPFLNNWIAEFETVVINWAKKAVELDDFTIYTKTTMTSSSLFDIITIFNETVSFLENLNLDDEAMKDVYLSYARICNNALSYVRDIYIALIDGRKEAVRKFVDKWKDPRYEGSADCNVQIKFDTLSIQQTYVIINNLFEAKNEWKNYKEAFSVKHHVQIDDDPLSGIVAIVNNAMEIFKIEVEYITYMWLFKPLWEKQKWYKKGDWRVRKTIIDGCITVADNLIDLIGEYINPLQTILHRNFHGKAVTAVFKGVRAGILHCFVPYILDRNVEVYTKVVSTLNFTMKTFIQSMPAPLQQRAMNEISFLKFGEELIDKGFNDSANEEINPEDEPKLFIRACTVKQLAKTKGEKKIAKGIRTIYINHNFLTPIGLESEHKKKKN